MLLLQATLRRQVIEAASALVNTGVTVPAAHRGLSVILIPSTSLALRTPQLTAHVLYSLYAMLMPLSQAMLLGQVIVRASVLANTGVTVLAALLGLCAW